MHTLSFFSFFFFFFFFRHSHNYVIIIMPFSIMPSINALLNAAMEKDQRVDVVAGKVVEGGGGVAVASVSLCLTA